MKEEVIIDTLKRGKSIHEEQQALWEAMDELWPPGKYEEEQKNYCLHDEVDDFIIDKINLGDVLIETISLETPDYPKKSGASMNLTPKEDINVESPFSILSKLKE